MIRLIVLLLLVSAAQAAEKTVNRANPDMSVNTLLLGRANTGGGAVNSEKPSGFHLQELESRFTSNVDPYFRADAVISVHEEVSPEGESRGFHVEPEEAFVETLGIDSVTIRAGKFKAFFNRHNMLHTHSFPLIDQPMVYDAILGEEGLNEIGVSAAYLVPTPWYFEIVPQILGGSNENIWGTPTFDDPAGLLYVKNLWDLSSNTTLECDLSYGYGKTLGNEDSHLGGAALTFKTKTSGARTYSLTLEGLRHQVRGGKRIGGAIAWVQAQVALRWWLAFRAEYLGLPAPSENASEQGSVLLGFVPTEYSALRLQYDYARIFSETWEREHRVTLQLNVSIGAHPAHAY